METVVKSVTGRWSARSFAKRFLLCGLFWFILSEGIWIDWPVALIAILLATAVSFMVWQQGLWRWSIFSFFKFAPYFFWQSILGGVDVARRAFSPSLPLAPGLIEFPLRLKSESANIFFVWVVSLLPGTASVRLHGNTLRLHALDTRMRLKEKLIELEDHLIVVFK